VVPLNLLDTIHGHKDLAGLSAEDRVQLCREIREFLIANVSQTGGHVASNLGVVELTVALETVFNTEIDRLVFDVGHQSYIHKILTDRQADFNRLRQFGGIAGFPKPSESNTDAFVAGHASSSVSIALGMARARTLQGQDHHVVVLMGDGAVTGGMAYEGLNDASVSNEKMVIVLNDNAMSIDNNVGGMASHLRALRTKERYLGMKARCRSVLLKVPGGRFIYNMTSRFKNWLRRVLIPTTIFENMGFTYLGPVDGHDTEHLISLLRVAKDVDGPVVLHVMTQKGRGYVPAEEHPKLFHGIGKFDPETGEPLKKATETFSEAFGSTLVELAEGNDKVCAITAAMPGGTGLLDFKKRFPDRLFDVGIAEEHAVSMAGGLAKQGMVPVVALYSTFLQRAYDMILQDVCMLGLHVVFAVDRAGLVGEDGETHHGVFDTGFLRHAPGMLVLCPASRQELKDMLRWAVEDYNGPVAIRYPRGGGGTYSASAHTEDGLVCHRSGENATLLTYGTMINNVIEASEILEKAGISAAVLRLQSMKPLPVEAICKHIPKNGLLVVAEEANADTGIAAELAFEIGKLRRDISARKIDLGHEYVTHGAVDVLYEQHGLSAQRIADFVQEAVNEN
jgi:1-deoxy-D-xylulose-5-phosphate synthase